MFQQVLPPYVDPKAIDLLSNLLVYNPEHRMTSSSALGHPYLQVVDSNSGDSSLEQSLGSLSIEKTRPLDQPYNEGAALWEHQFSKLFKVSWLRDVEGGSGCATLLPKLLGYPD